MCHNVLNNAGYIKSSHNGLFVGICLVHNVLIVCYSTDPDYDPKQAKKLEKELKKMEGKKDGEKTEGKKHHFRATAKAVSLASKLSPKSQRKKEKAESNIAQLKVGHARSKSCRYRSCSLIKLEFESIAC